MNVIIKLIGEWISIDRDVAVSKKSLLCGYRIVLKKNRLSFTRKFTKGDGYALHIYH